MKTMYRCLSALGLAAAAAVTGCADTEIQGVVQDKDINEPDLMIGLARGMQSEFEDPWVATGFQHIIESPTDGLSNDDTSTTDEILTVSDFRSRPQNSPWAQFHEAIWAAIYARQRFSEVYSPEEFEVSPFAARVMVLGGYAERILGETYCELVYNYGLEGGILLTGANTPYDPGRFVPRDSAFRRSIAMLEIGLSHAEAGVAAAVEVPDNDPVFDPQRIVYAAHGGLAQTYADLGDWEQAVEHARLVPDDFADHAVTHNETDGGYDLADEMLGSDDISIYRTPAALLWPDDPRVALSKCGDWADENLDFSEDTPPTSAFVRMNTTCGTRTTEYRSESNRYPLWISLKFTDSTDVEVVSGAEMRLLEAEAALLDGNLGEFTSQINRARAIRGLDPIDEPATAGALEYPNAEDDAWSILDRERYLEMFLEGRRFWDLARWNHPYFADSNILLPRHAEFLPPGGRMSCPDLQGGSGWGFPVTGQECDTNPSLSCPVLAGG